GPEGSVASGRRRGLIVPDSSDDAVVLEILRGRRPVSGADAVVQAGDRLLVRGEWRHIRAVRKARKLRFDHVAGDIDGDAADAERVQVEAMVSPGSHLIGNTLAGMRFGHMYRARVQGIHRRLLDIRQPLDHVQLSLGDVLLLDVPEPAIEDLRADKGMIVLGTRKEAKVDVFRASMSVLVMVATIVVAATGLLPIVAAALIGCAALLVFRLLEPDEAYRAIDWRVILLLAGIIPLGVALQKSGGAALAAEFMITSLGQFGPLATLAAVYLMTSIATEFMSNNASAVLVVPIALAAAESLGVDRKPLLVAVAFAASTSFATPISYQTNTMVFTAGGYRFSDFVRMGIPLNIIFCTAAILLIPRYFPF